MTERERRIVRAMARLAVAVECLDRANLDIAVLDNDLANMIDRRAGSIRWAVERLRRQLRDATVNGHSR